MTDYSKLAVHQTKELQLCSDFQIPWNKLGVSFLLQAQEQSMVEHICLGTLDTVVLQRLSHSEPTGNVRRSPEKAETIQFESNE